MDELAHLRVVIDTDWIAETDLDCQGEAREQLAHMLLQIAADLVGQDAEDDQLIH